MPSKQFLESHLKRKKFCSVKKITCNSLGDLIKENTFDLSNEKKFSEQAEMGESGGDPGRSPTQGDLKKILAQPKKMLAFSETHDIRDTTLEKRFSERAKPE